MGDVDRRAAVAYFLFVISARCSMVLAAAVHFFCPAPHNQPAAATAPNIYTYISLGFLSWKPAFYLVLAGKVARK